MTDQALDVAEVADPFSPFALVPCECARAGTPGRRVRYVNGRPITSACRECIGTPGERLRGEPPDSPYELVLDFRAAPGPQEETR